MLADGTSTRSYTALYLEEDVAISYGMKHEHCKSYELRRIIFYDGSHSSGGHYTCAERMQLGSCYQKGDSWRYLDSSKEPEVVSLHQLYMERGRDVAGLLLVVKSRPADTEGNMPVVMAEEQARYKSPSVDSWLYLAVWLAGRLCAACQVGLVVQTCTKSCLLYSCCSVAVDSNDEHSAFVKWYRIWWTLPYIVECNQL